ncbi:MAG: hypothetical protein LBT47_05370 [Deltaproteobacteria bacterium]|jgi:hypothetical protein|nr:hypothetical protein [Deltaproteobacteria bacterium]
MSNQTPTARSTGGFGDILRAAVIVRLTARVLTVGLVLALSAFKGLFWGWGVVMAGLLLEGNLDAFVVFIRKARPGVLKTSLWVTLIWFYLIFILTILVCFLVIRFKLGHPVGFLTGLGIFLPSILAGLLSVAFAGNAIPAAGPPNRPDLPLVTAEKPAPPALAFSSSVLSALDDHPESRTAPESSDERSAPGRQGA